MAAKKQKNLPSVVIVVVTFNYQFPKKKRSFFSKEKLHNNLHKAGQKKNNENESNGREKHYLTAKTKTILETVEKKDLKFCYPFPAQFLHFPIPFASGHFLPFGHLQSYHALTSACPRCKVVAWKVQMVSTQDSVSF